jgi:hypothetical protein
MKTNLVLVSMLAVLAPLTSACVETTPADVLPAEAMPLELGGSTAAAPALQVMAKQGAPTQSHIFPREAMPFGASYEDWAAEWWQWALSIPVGENPMKGGACELHQSGDVFFLAGTNGGAATRSCTIPTGKGIFFPLVNVVFRACPELSGGSYTCDLATADSTLHECASWYIDNGDETLLLEIDGAAVGGLDEYRAHSEPFFDTSPLDPAERVSPTCSGPIEANPCGVPVGSQRHSVADGYWAMLRPLPVGQHQVRFAAAMGGDGWGGFSLDVTYNIVVAP